MVLLLLLQATNTDNQPPEGVYADPKPVSQDDVQLELPFDGRSERERESNIKQSLKYVRGTNIDKEVMYCPLVT